MSQQQKQSISERRRRSGALHAQTCEEYLKVSKLLYGQRNMNKLDKQQQEKVQEKKSMSESAFINFDFIPEDEGVEDIARLKILIYSPKLKINEQEFLQILKRLRNRSITTDNLPNARQTFDFDFFYREYEVNKKNMGLHFWIQNNPKNKHTLFFSQNYYRFFNAVILLQRDNKLKIVNKRNQSQLFHQKFPFMDELLMESLQSIIAEICHSYFKS